MSEPFPRSMQPIVAAIGRDATLALVDVYRGTKVWVPTPANVVEDHPIAQLLGMDLAVKLAAVAGGRRLTIPLCECTRHAMADADILERHRRGESARRIALAHQTTERSILRRIARLRANPQR